MSDFEIELARLRAECDQEILADGEWADITLPATFLRRLIDAVETNCQIQNPKSKI